MTHQMITMQDSRGREEDLVSSESLSQSLYSAGLGNAGHEHTDPRTAHESVEQREDDQARVRRMVIEREPQGQHCNARTEANECHHIVRPDAIRDVTGEDTTHDGGSTR